MYHYLKKPVFGVQLHVSNFESFEMKFCKLWLAVFLLFFLKNDLQTAIAIMSALNYRKPPRLRIEPALIEPLSFIDRVRFCIHFPVVALYFLFRLYENSHVSPLRGLWHLKCVISEKQ